MSKTLIVVSSYVDNIIKEQQPDVNFLIFNTLQELSNFIETTPIRATSLYITKETLQPAVNTSLNFLVTMLRNPFLSVDAVEYVTSKEGEELASVNFIITECELKNWNITQGNLTREFITGLISGTLRNDDVVPTRKAIFRQRKDDYVKERMKSKESFGERYITDEEELSDIPDEDLIPVFPVESDSVCRVVNIAGLPNQERTVFAFVMSQYLSFSGKTIIVEKDYDYLTLSDMVTKSGVKFVKIDLSELYGNISENLRYIRNTAERLIVITGSERGSFNYNFICNLLYNNLSSELAFFVRENNLEEVASTADYITTLPNNVVDVIRTVELLPDNYKTNCSFVGVNMRKIPELNILNGKALSMIIQDLLQYSFNVVVPIVSIASLKLGGEAHDLRMLLANR